MYGGGGSLPWWNHTLSPVPPCLGITVSPSSQLLLLFTYSIPIYSLQKFSKSGIGEEFVTEHSRLGSYRM